MRPRQFTIAEVEYTAFHLAEKFMTWDEPTPEFGSRFQSILESCLGQPFMRFGGKDLHRGLIGKGSILFYLLIKNPPLYKAERTRSRGIFILGDESRTQASKKSRTRTVLIIYGACVALFSCVYGLNRLNGAGGLGPLDIASSVSVMLFGFSILSYLPFAIYLLWKNPWQYKEEGLCLNRMYFVYGGGLLIFSIFFAVHWLKTKGLSVAAVDVLWSVLIVFGGSAAVSCLPVLIYVYMKIIRPYKKDRIHPNTIFVIYSLCFLIFSSIYAVNWMSDKKAGLEQKPYEKIP